MYNEAINKIESMKKLRFVNCNKKFEGNKEIIKLSVDEVTKFLKIKLNMLQLKKTIKTKNSTQYADPVKKLMKQRNIFSAVKTL